MVRKQLAEERKKKELAEKTQRNEALNTATTQQQQEPQPQLSQLEEDDELEDI